MAVTTAPPCRRSRNTAATAVHRQHFPFANHGKLRRKEKQSMFSLESKQNENVTPVDSSTINDGVEKQKQKGNTVFVCVMFVNS